jgi:hypothetical protein
MEARNIIRREVEPLCHSDSSKPWRNAETYRTKWERKNALQEGAAEIFSGIFSGERDAGADEQFTNV